MISAQDVLAAQKKIDGLVRRTPVIDVVAETPVGRSPLTLKLELLQHTGSFKPRGIFNKLTSTDVPDAGVVIASGGNAGIATAYAASVVGVSSEIYIPQTTPAVKRAAIAARGATIREVGSEYAETYLAAKDRAYRIADLQAAHLHQLAALPTAARPTST